MKRFKNKEVAPQLSEVVTDRPSLTLPDMAKNPRQLLGALNRGQNINAFAGQYDDELGMEIPQLHRMTRIEKLEYIANQRKIIQETIQKADHEYKQAQSKAKKAKASTDSATSTTSQNSDQPT